MTYIYGCSVDKDVKVEVVHSMKDNPMLPCPKCGKPMHRIPQVSRWYRNPAQVLLDRLAREYEDIKSRKQVARG